MKIAHCAGRNLSAEKCGTLYVTDLEPNGGYQCRVSKQEETQELSTLCLMDLERRVQKQMPGNHMTRCQWFSMLGALGSLDVALEKVTSGFCCYSVWLQ